MFFNLWLLALSAVITIISVYHQLHTKFWNYLANVVNKSKRDLELREASPVVSKLYRLSQSILSLREHINDDEDAEVFSGEIQTEEIEHRTIGLQTESCQNLAKQHEYVKPLLESDTDQSWRQNKHNSFCPTFSDNNIISLQTIRDIQKDQLHCLLGRVTYFGEKDLKSPLVICVEANSANVSGYLLDFKKKVCKFYIYGYRNLPWKTEPISREVDNLTEYKMKNLIFALLLWEPEILAMKKFSLFCNCAIINQPDSIHGKISIDYLEHFTSCKNVVRVNSNPQVSKYRDTHSYARLIQPARDLMTWKLSNFHNYIKKAYGIFDFEGSHSFMDDYQDDAKDDGYFAKTSRFHFFLQKVNKNEGKLANGCENCQFEFKHLKRKTSESEIIPFPLTNDFW